MSWNLYGGVAVVTGAASGIGRALAQRLAGEGMSLALADVDAEGLEETVRLCGAVGGTITTHVVDVSDATRMARFAADVIACHVRVTLLINNAGVALFGTAEELSVEEIDWLMRVNFSGVVYGVKYFLPYLRREPRAHIVNLSSIFGIIASEGNSAYCASKFAIRGFTEVLQKELAGSTIGVSCVHPGKIRTRISRHVRVSEGVKNRATPGTGLDGVESRGLTSPEAAANRIVEGVKRKKLRILIGPDAIWYDRIQRAFPVHYEQVLKPLRKLGGVILSLARRSDAGRSSEPARHAQGGAKKIIPSQDA